MTQRGLPQHVSSECVYTCTICAQSVQRSARSEHRNAVDPALCAATVRCPNACPKPIVRKAVLDAHVVVCPNARVRCHDEACLKLHLRGELHRDIVAQIDAVYPKLVGELSELRQVVRDPHGPVPTAPGGPAAPSPSPTPTAPTPAPPSPPKSASPTGGGESLAIVEAQNRLIFPLVVELYRLANAHLDSRQVADLLFTSGSHTACASAASAVASWLIAVPRCAVWCWQPSAR